MRNNQSSAGGTLAPSAVAFATNFCFARVRIPPGGLLFYRNSNGIFCKIKKTALNKTFRTEYYRGTTRITAAPLLQSLKYH